jgi:hypothetical protein
VEKNVAKGTRKNDQLPKKGFLIALDLRDVTPGHYRAFISLRAN